MEVLGDALVREEQTAEIPIMNPKVLERAKASIKTRRRTFRPS